MSLAPAGILSGNLMSKLTSKSPLLLGSLGNGKPLPAIRFVVLGLITSFNKFNWIFSPDNVGTLTIVPHNACKNTSHNNVKT